MKRRDFLTRAIPVSTIPFLLNGFSVRAYGRSPILDTLVGVSSVHDHVLVLIQLNGGNDGLNMVIPRDQYSNLMNARGNIAIAENLVLGLNDATGLHPAMSHLQDLFQDEKICVVQSVGYPNPNFSHFRATDIWLTGSASNETLTSGWLGRYLDGKFDGYPDGYPNEVMPDPLAIQIGSVVSLGLQGPEVSMGMAITSPTSFYQLVTGGVDEAPNTPAGHELTFIRQVAQQTELYAVSISNAATQATNQSPLYPAEGTNSLADQLKIVAQLIGGGLKTRMYIVNLGGFDTHSNQIDETVGTDVGQHATLLSKLSVAIAAFQDDIRRLGAEQRVIGMTFSEFGRRIKSNASWGTDHGAAAPVILFGTSVAPALIGSNPIIPASATVNDNIPMQYDFRSVYGTILRQWFHVPQADVRSILFPAYQMLPLFRESRRSERNKAGHGSADGTTPFTLGLSQNYPNPFNPSTKIKFRSDGSHLSITVFDMLGREIRRLADGALSPGEHEVSFDAADLPGGTYYYRLQSGSHQEIKSMLLVR